jgi:type IV secretion system protein VirB6
MNKFIINGWNLKIAAFVLAIFNIVFHSIALAADEQPFDWDAHNSSLLNYETYYNSTAAVDNCFSSGKIMVNSISELDQTYMPGTITRNDKPPPAGGTGWAIGSMAATFTTMAFFITNPLGWAAGILVAGIELAVMIDACTNTYVVAPHEYFNRQDGKTCQIVDGVATYVQPNALTINDIPFFYHCDPMYDPIDKASGGTGTLSTKNDKDASFIGRTYGYMGAASQYCTGNLRTYGDRAKQQGLVGKIIVESAPWISRRSQEHNCSTQEDTAGRWTSHFGPGEDHYVYPLKLYSYYKMFDKTGKIRMCVASIYTMLPVRIACGTIAPPGDENSVDPFLKAYVSDTRCAYLIQPRKDLQSLGASLSQTDQDGNSRKSVKLFLQSDFHFTSTVVGCLKDMITKIFIKAPSGGAGTHGEKPFFQKVQERLKSIVLAILVLYVAFVGIKVMTSPEPPKRGEAIMMIIKFALVFYFAVGTGLYEVDEKGKVTGLFPQLINVTDELANMFLEAQNSNEGLGFCSYKYKGKNLLGENLYQGNGVTNTVGYEGVKLTFWDLVDCKLINYLNVGSCDYSASGLVIAWLVGVAFWVTGYGFLLSIASLVYCFLILLVIFRFAHIFILALITVTVLFFLAPIFIPFVLFEATKGIFDKWMKTILGYLLYPALLFAFLAIMLATMDSVYYGNFNKGVNNTKGQPINLKTACDKVDSIYCFIMSDIITNSNDACDLSPGTIANKEVIYNQKVSYLGEKSVLKPDFAAGLFKIMLKLMLFAFLFYLFMGAVTSFLAALLAVQDIGGLAKGDINALGALGKIGSGAGSAAKGVAGMMSQKSQDKDK